MALPQIERARVTKRLTAFCEDRVPAVVRGKLRIGFRVRASEIVLFEERPAFRPPHEWQEMVVAKFKYVATKGVWTLYCQHRDNRWHSYVALPRARSFDKLLDEVSADPTGIFWG